MHFGSVTAQVAPLPAGGNGLATVRATLRRMVAIARRYRQDATTAMAARTIITHCGITDVRAQRLATISCVQRWVRDRIVYVPDPRDVEMLQTPPQTLKKLTGDCDDKSLLVATLLETLGFHTEFLAVGGNGAGWGHGVPPGTKPPYSHVLAAVQYGARTGRLPPFLDGWLTLETIVPGAGPGYMPAGVRVIMPARV